MTDLSGIVLLGAYGLFLFAASLKVWAGQDSSESFFVNRRSSGAWGVALSIIMSCVGASATLGVIGKAFTVGLPAVWWLGAGALGLVALALVLAEKVRESGAYTMPELAERHLGARARPLMSLVIVVAWIAILAAQFTALDRVLLSLTGLGAGARLAFGFGLIVIHSTGGQAAVMRMDRLQSFLLLGGLAAVLVWLWARNPGWAAQVRPELLNDKFGFRELVYYLFVVGGNYLVCPMLFGRLLSAKNAAAARRGGLYAAAGLCLCSLLITAIGLTCVGLAPADTPPDGVFTAIADTLLPSWMRLLLLMTLISAIVSSADTCLITAATVFSYDLIRRPEPSACRAAVLGIGAAGLLLSMLDKSILEFLCMAYDVYVCGVVAPVFIGLLAGRKAFVLSSCACLAVVCGGALGTASALLGIHELSYAGMLTAALFTLAGLRRRPATGPAPA